MLIEDKIKEIKDKVRDNLKDQDITLDKINDIKINILGKKGIINNIFKELRDVSVDEKATIGALINKARDEVVENIKNKQMELENRNISKKLMNEKIDVTLPADEIRIGNSHVIQQIIDKLENYFLGRGYKILEGPEIELDKYNFEMMNLPKDHPARDMQDTFYITEDILMRTQTSPMQVRAMLTHDFEKGPLKMVSPGKVYRRDTDDATHSHQFHQMEGLVIDENITMSDLKGTLYGIIKNIFGDEHKIRLRPSYFPFTEPSVEVDISWGIDENNNEPEWIEVLGAGMVHPNVLEMSGIDSNKYQGFAFGIGPDRFAMLKYGIKDIRNFYLNDIRFLKQFKLKG